MLAEMYMIHTEAAETIETTDTGGQIETAQISAIEGTSSDPLWFSMYHCA